MGLSDGIRTIVLGAMLVCRVNQRLKRSQENNRFPLWSLVTLLLLILVLKESSLVSF